MYGHMTLTPRYWDAKQVYTLMYTWIINIAIDVAKTSHMTSLQVYDLSTHFIENLSIVGDYLIRNNIFLDKAYDLSTYLINIDWSNNSKSW